MALKGQTYQAMTLLDVQDVPEVDDDGNADGEHSKDTVHLGCPCKGHEGTARQEPQPPVIREIAGRSGIRIGKYSG